MKQSLVITCLAALAVMLIAYVVGGGSLLVSGLSKALNTGLKSSLMLAASFLVIGQIQVLLSQELLDRWLQNFKGIKGVVLSALAGSLFLAVRTFSTLSLPALQRRRYPLYSHFVHVRKTVV